MIYYKPDQVVKRIPTSCRTGVTVIHLRIIYAVIHLRICIDCMIMIAIYAPQAYVCTESDYYMI